MTNNNFTWPNRSVNKVANAIVYSIHVLLASTGIEQFPLNWLKDMHLISIQFFLLDSKGISLIRFVN